MWILKVSAQDVQDKSLRVENLDYVEDKHKISIFGEPSGCGKSNATLTQIFHPNGARFEKIYGHF